MIYNNIYLLLTDVSMTESTATRDRQIVITNEGTVRDTYRPNVQMMKDLYSSSSTATLQIKSATSCTWIMQAEGNIHCKVYEGDPSATGNTPIFVGYLSDKYTWGYTTAKEKVLEITIEDPSIKAFDRLYVSAPTYKSWSTLREAVEDIIDTVNEGLSTEEQISLGGITTVSVNLSKKIDVKETVADILSDICFECGCVYYFAGDGSLCTATITSTTESATELNRDNLIAYNNKEVWSVEKSVIQYKNAKVWCNTLKTYTGALVYNHTEGATTGNPYCYVEVPAHTAFPSMVTITSETTDEELRLVDQCEKILEEPGAGKVILAMNNVVQHVVGTGFTPGTGHNYIDRMNDEQLWCLAKNTTSSTHYITRFQATADVTVEDETIAERTGEELDLDKVYEYECKYLHDQASIKKLANLIAQYYQNSNKTYTFYSRLDLPLATTVYNVNASPYGLSTKVLPIKKETLRNIYKYTAVGYAAFELTRTTNHTDYVPWSIGAGPAGPAGESGTAYLWDFKMSAQAYNIDKRSTGTTTITLTSSASGYTDVPHWTTTFGTLSAATGDEVTLSIPGNASVSSITVTMSGTETTGLEPVSKNLTGIDITTYDICYNYITDPSAITGTIIDGDYFICNTTGSTYTKGMAYEYSNGGWVTIQADSPSRATKLLNSLNILRKNDVDLSDVSNSNTVAWFSNIVASSGVFDKLFANEITMSSTGVIKSNNYDGTEGSGTANNFTQGYKLKSSDGTLRAVGAILKGATISGNSTFTGSITSDALIVKQPQTGVTKTLLLDSTQYWLTAVLIANMQSAGMLPGNAYTLTGNYTGVYYFGSDMDALISETDTTEGTYYTFTASCNTPIQFVAKTRDTSATQTFTWSVNGGTETTSNTGFYLSGLQYGDVVRYKYNTSSTDRTIQLRALNFASTSADLARFITSTGTTYDVNVDDVLTDVSSRPLVTYNGTSIANPIVYKWNNSAFTATIAGSSASGTLTLKNATGTIDITGDTVTSVDGTVDTSTGLVPTISIGDANGNHFTIQSDGYYQALSGTITVTQVSSGVQAKSIVPMDHDTYDLGASDVRWKDIYASGEVYADVGSFSTGILGNLIGNVNGAGTTNTVYGAVFN